jgi:hypothetical protein
MVVMAGEPDEVERLVAQRILEQLGEGGLQRLTEAQHKLVAQLKGGGQLVAEVSAVEAQLGDSVGIKDSAKFVISPGPAVMVLQGASPELANDIKDRSPHEITLVINIFLAFLQTLQVLLRGTRGVDCDVRALVKYQPGSTPGRGDVSDR